MANFQAFGLHPSLLKQIEREGFDSATPIQDASIPPLMEGQDLIGLAQTGGGKTAAYLLPLLHKLAQNDAHPVPNSAKALILAPTRELAQQIGQAIRTFSRGLKIRHTVIFGGAAFRPQIFDLRRGVDILVATPGRLMDHVNRGNVMFDLTADLVLDEADRMLDMGFIDDVRLIAKALPEKHQTAMFSATLHKGIEKLAHQLLNEPVRVEIKRETTVASTISHRVRFLEGRFKDSSLHQLLEDETARRVIVFTRTKAGADNLVGRLENKGIDSRAIHGDKPQWQREKTLRAFHQGRVRVLVATDVAARGIHVDDVTHVINYDLPMDSENYVHRVGRTGRAGAEGAAISFCTAEDMGLLRGIERLLKQPIEVDLTHAHHIDIRQKPSKPGKHRPRNKGGFKGRGGKGGAKNQPFGRGKGSNDNSRKDGAAPLSKPQRRHKGGQSRKTAAQG